MPRFPRPINDQLRNLTADDFCSALKRDAWVLDVSGGGAQGAQRVYIKTIGSVKRRVVIHYHPRKTYGQQLRDKILEQIGWNTADLIRLGLVKVKGAKARASQRSTPAGEVDEGDSVKP